MMTYLRHERSNEDVLSAVAGQTIPRLFAGTVGRQGNETALRWKTGDGWGEWTWSEYADRALRTASALRELGVGHGDRVALMLTNRPEFHPIDMACYFLGATPFSVYNSSSPEQVEYLLGHSEAKAAVVGARFVATVDAAREHLPQLENLVVVTDEGADAPAGLSSWAELLDAHSPLDLAEAADVADPEDTATFIYTSGTTGPPKAVMLSHRNICWLLESLLEVMGMEMAGRQMLSYLPMAHVAERIFTHYQPARTGAVVTPCPDPAAVGAYLPEVRPEAFFGPPRVFEKTRSALISALSATEESAALLERGLDVGRRMFEARTTGSTPTPELAAEWEEVDKALFANVRAQVGLDACQVAFTGAAPPPVEVIEFFNFIGVPFAEVYGLSEDTALMATEVERPRPGSVGRPIPGCEIRLLDDGEILCRGGHVFHGYFKDEEKTAEILDEDGWLHSGDIGTVDEDGYISIVDRKKELIITAGGKNLSPANIEAGLKTIPLVDQACAIGDRRPYVTALLVLDPDATKKWAAENGLADLTMAELAANPDLHAEVERHVAETNEHLANVERVKKFVLLSDEWQPDSDLLTPTMKLKRRGVLEHYGAAIDALYEG